MLWKDDNRGFTLIDHIFLQRSLSDREGKSAAKAASFGGSVVLEGKFVTLFGKLAEQVGSDVLWSGDRCSFIERLREYSKPKKSPITWLDPSEEEVLVAGVKVYEFTQLGDVAVTGKYGTLYISPPSEEGQETFGVRVTYRVQFNQLTRIPELFTDQVNFVSKAPGKENLWRQELLDALGFRIETIPLTEPTTVLTHLPFQPPKEGIFYLGYTSDVEAEVRYLQECSRASGLEFQSDENTVSVIKPVPTGY